MKTKLRRLAALYRRLRENPKARLVARAVWVGCSIFWSQYVTGNVELRAAVVAGALAAFEVLTPANQLVGLFKRPAG